MKRRVLWACLLSGFLLFAGAKVFFALRPDPRPQPIAIVAPHHATGRRPTIAASVRAPFHLKFYVFSRTLSAYDMDLNVFGMRIAAQVLGFFDPFHFYSVEEVCQGDPLPLTGPGTIVVTHEYFRPVNGVRQDTGLILVPGPIDGAQLNETGRFYVAPPGTLESIYGTANVFYCGKLGPGTLGAFGIMRTLIARSCADHLVWHPFWKR